MNAISTTVLFTPTSGDDPMTLQFPNYANIHSLWVPNPTNRISIQIPSANTWITYYQILTLTAESIPLDEAPWGVGYPLVRIAGDGTGGAAFYITYSTAYVSPYKAAA